MSDLMLPRAKINGIQVNAFKSREQLISLTEDASVALVAINAEKVINVDQQMRAFINRNVGFIDGVAIQVRFAMNSIAAPKIPGCELWLDLVQQHSLNKSFYLVGATQVVIDETIAKLKQFHPAIQIVGYRHGYLKTVDESRETALHIALMKPDIVFVAMGSPRQERFIELCQVVHKNALYLGVGGSFDLYTGRLSRAPAWLISLGLEWAYRWVKEPFTRTGRILRLLHFLKRSRFVRMEKSRIVHWKQEYRS